MAERTRILLPLTVILTLIVAFALVLRVYRLDHQSLWIDEIYTLTIAPLPWPQMSAMIDQSDNGKPPLYNLFMHQWIQGGTGEFWVRLPSALFGALTCLLAALLGTFFFGRKGWIVGLLLALSPFHLWYSQETRLYTMLGLFSSLAFYFHLQFCLRHRALDLLLFTLAGILTCYTFPYGFLFLAVTAASAFFYRPSLPPRQLALDAAAHVLIFLSFVPWIFRMVHVALTTPGQFQRGHNFEVLVYSFNNLFFGSSLGIPPYQLHQPGSLLHDHPVGIAVFLFTLFVSFLTLCAGLVVLFRENWNAFVFSTAGLLVFLGSPFVISVLKPTITNNPRYSFLALLPVLVAVAAFLLHVLERPSLFSRLLALLLVAGIAASLFNHYFVAAYSRDNMRAAAATLARDPNVDAIYVSEFYEVPVFSYYYHGPAHVISVEFHGEDPATKAQGVKALAPAARHPALVYVRPDLGDPDHCLPPLFANLFHPTDTQQWTGVTLYRYDAVPAN